MNKVYVLFEDKGFGKENILKGVFSSVSKVKEAFQKLNEPFLFIEIWNIDELSENIDGKNYGYVENLKHFNNSGCDKRLGV